MILEKLLDSSKNIIIAIDGTAGSGKGTISKLLAEKFNLFHCQTSLFYRSLAFAALKNYQSPTEDQIIDLSTDFPIIESKELYSPEVTEMTSIIAAITEVRKNLVIPQQKFLQMHNRIVMEGRDIGTVIAPNADLKLFITASLDVRAERRYEQMNGSVPLEQIKQDIYSRDLRDTSRASSPLAKATNAIEIDTSTLTPEQIIDQILKL